MNRKDRARRHSRRAQHQVMLHTGPKGRRPKLLPDATNRALSRGARKRRDDRAVRLITNPWEWDYSERTHEQEDRGA